MGPSRLTRTGLMVGAIAALAACADSSSPGSFLTPDASLAAISTPGDGVASHEVFEVCKTYAEGSGPDVTIDVNDGTATTQNTLSSGECENVYTSGPTRNITVTETVPANYTVTYVKTTIINNVTTVFAPVASNTASGSIGGTPPSGVLVRFTNTLIPPPPPPFCTLTQGYWKNHGEDWDDAGDNTPFLTSDLFFNSGLTYLTILNTAPKGGNAYLQLAHQYIAAVLNTGGNPSGDDDVDEAIADAEAFFTAAAAGTPAPAKDSQLRADVLADASTLDQFNNGILGPGHCND
jgi:hypothetical protein